MDISVVRGRVEALLGMSVSLESQQDREVVNGLYNGALGVMKVIYGQGSSQERALMMEVEALRKQKGADWVVISESAQTIRGVLASIKGELELGFLGSLRASLTGEVMSDLIKLARASLEESGDGAKNVAAVLTAAAFEDVVRRIADLKGVGHREKLADVLTGLKELEILRGSEVGIAQAYLNFRNVSLHAEWEKVDRAVIESALGFIEQMILKHLV